MTAGGTPAPTAERGATARRIDWNAARSGDWQRAVRTGDRRAARDLYEELGAVLDEEVAEGGGYPVLSVPEINDRIRSHLASVAGDRALDLGCGPTPVAALALAESGFTAVGLDVAASIVRLAQSAAGGRVELLVADAERLPFPDGSFDVVTCDDTIEHVFDQAALVSETARVLRRGGTLVLVTPNASGVHVQRARARDVARGRRWARERYHITDSHVRELRWRELSRLVAPHFRRRSVEVIDYPDSGAWRLVNRFLRLPGAWRFAPVHFMVLERLGAGPAAHHYGRRTDAASQTSPPAVRAFVDEQLPLLSSAAPVLDVGCGTGENLAMLERAGVAAIGVDVSAAALAPARRLAPVVAADAAHLPFHSGAFGGAVCTEVLEHVDDPAAVLAETARVTLPDAPVVVTSPNYANLAGLHKLIADRRSGRHDWNPWGAHEGGFEAFLTARRLRAAARPHFRVSHVRALDYGQALTGRFAALDRLAWSRTGRAVVRRLLPLLEHPRLPLARWHGMHSALVLRRVRR